ncbi:MAG: hypothetical protein H6Q74_1910 [Firmicutes bacterium]|nr:hypothetical protein [Bacillota bacterium]
MLHSGFDDYFAMKIHELCQALSSCPESSHKDKLEQELETVLLKFNQFRKENIKEL